MIADFGITADGQVVRAITLESAALRVVVLTYGAALQSVRLGGVAHDLTLGSDRLADYEGPMRYHGTLVGPVANRLARARAQVGDAALQLVPNEGANLLHSGPGGMQGRVWDVLAVVPDSVTLGLVLDGDGFPGRRQVQVLFAVTGAVLRLEVMADTDAPTLMNVAQHSYWNLTGGATWAGHALRIAAEAYLPVTTTGIPTGEVRAVAGGSLDFRKARVIAPGDPAMDMNFCVSDARVALREVLWLQGDAVRMAFATTEPGVQVYDGAHSARPGHRVCEGLAIEAQGWPDAPNHVGFPAVELWPGDRYHQITEWRFGRI